MEKLKDEIEDILKEEKIVQFIDENNYSNIIKRLKYGFSYYI